MKQCGSSLIPARIRRAGTGSRREIRVDGVWGGEELRWECRPGRVAMQASSSKDFIKL
jgi:hypothetical protein